MKPAVMVNLLPFDGIVNYYGSVFDKPLAQKYFNILLKSIEWRNDEIILFGKHMITKRKVAWYADNGYEYTYSNNTKKGLAFTKELSGLKLTVEKITGETFNSCLLNLYHDGSEGMSWHADNEKEIKLNSAIASLSFGVERRFLLKHRQTKLLIPFALENGSLLVMKGETQACWLHSLPKSLKIAGCRINLTFRKMVF